MPHQAHARHCARRRNSLRRARTGVHKATVKKVDVKAKKVTLIHEELKSLEMPAMTMVFRVQDDAIPEKLKEGANVEFAAERVNGKLTVTEVN